MIPSEANRLAHEILEEQKNKIKGKGIAAIDLEERKVIEVVKESEALSLLQKLSKEYSNRRIYLLRTEARKPVVWSIS